MDKPVTVWTHSNEFPLSASNRQNSRSAKQRVITEAMSLQNTCRSKWVFKIFQGLAEMRAFNAKATIGNGHIVFLFIQPLATTDYWFERLIVITCLCNFHLFVSPATGYC